MKNLEEFDIDEFYGIITGFAWQDQNYDWDDRIRFVNSNSAFVSVGAGSEDGKVCLDYNGGEARFNLLKCDGEKATVLNHKSPYDFHHGYEYKITMTFKGKTIHNGEEKQINLIVKEYQLSFVYRDEENKTGLHLVCFEEYRG
ncbi:MAG: hypothetical protein JXB38_05925 [Anaerolineales bacterium]|nr:hypothetical protein [Anaerolineales bacterium]